RERRDDVPVLAEFFIQKLQAAENGGGKHFELSEGALELLQRYDWPGNVRELENALERAAILTHDGHISTELLPVRIIDPAPAPLISELPPANPTLELIERAYILWVLQAENGNKARAAEVL